MEQNKTNQEIDYKNLKEGEAPENRAYYGNPENFGKPNKSFKLCLAGLDNFEKDGLVEITLKTPKNRHLMKYALLASKLQQLNDPYNTDLSIFDDLLDYLTTHYDVATTFLDRVSPEELFTLIAFGAVISMPPSRDKVQK